MIPLLFTIMAFIRMKRIFILISIILLAISANTSAQNTVENTYMIKLKPQYRHLFSQKSITALLPDNKAQVTPAYPTHKPLLHKDNAHMVDLSLIYTLTTNKADTRHIQQLMQTGYFEYVQPKYTHQYLYIPNDELIDNQWHLNTIHAYDAWDICTGDSNVVIGISDSGLDTLVADIATNVKFNYNDPIDGIDNDNDGFTDNFWGWNTADNNNNIYKVLIHGTFVAGISSASTNNGSKLAGVAYNCKFLPVCNQSATLGLIGGYESIVYAADHGCKIINCSWGAPGPYDQYGQDIIDYATYNCGALVVAAAGNTNAQLSFYPAAYHNVLSVAATNISDEKADFSTYDYSVDITAPGKGVYSCLGNTYGTSDGTSFSAPIAAGVAALIKSYYPSFTPQQILHRIKATADNIDTVNNNSAYAGMLGSGRVNAYRALADSLMPSLEWEDISYNSDVKNIGDTIAVNGVFTNYLANGLQLSVQASLLSAHAQLLTPYIHLGNLNSLQADSTPTLYMVLNRHLTESETLVIKLDYYEDSTYLGSQYVPLYFSPCITMDINEQICSITGCGRLGYDDPYFKYGQGLRHYSQSTTMLTSGTLLFGTNSAHISDNIAGIDHDKEMRNLVLPHIIKDTARADMQVETIFNDDYAGATKLGIEVKHTAFAWTADSVNKTIIHQYELVNKTNADINQLYAALYMDWDIGEGACNRIQYDENYRMSYISPIFDGMYAGVKFLSPYNTRVYAFDIDGTNLSMNISNGITDLQKYNAMTTNRLEAGMGTYGNDVSLMSSYGPLNINARDTIKIAYAIITGNHQGELQSNAIKAQHIYDTLYIEHSTPEDTTLIAEGTMTNNCNLYPNPTGDYLHIQLSQEPISHITIYDIAGKVVLQYHNIDQNSYMANIKSLPAGMYMIKISSPTKIFVEKITKK